MPSPTELLKQFGSTYRRFAPRHPTLRFCWRVLIAMVVIIAFCTIFAGVPELSADRFWLVFYLVPVFAVLLGWFLLQLRRRLGPPVIAAIVAALLILFAVQAPLMEWDARRALAALPETAQATDVVALDLPKENETCGELCIEILAKARKPLRLG